jgi:hypothetical protein
MQSEMTEGYYCHVNLYLNDAEVYQMKMVDRLSNTLPETVLDEFVLLTSFCALTIEQELLQMATDVRAPRKLDKCICRGTFYLSREPWSCWMVQVRLRLDSSNLFEGSGSRLLVNAIM